MSERSRKLRRCEISLKVAIQIYVSDLCNLHNMNLIKKIGIISGMEEWAKLCGKTVMNEVVLIRRMDDPTILGIHCMRSKKDPIFPHATKIFVPPGTNKNFVFFCVRERVFPRAREVFLGSHPCEHVVLHRWGPDTRIYLDESYNCYKQSWAYANDRVIVTSNRFLYQENGIPYGYEEGPIYAD